MLYEHVLKWVNRNDSKLVDEETTMQLIVEQYGDAKLQGVAWAIYLAARTQRPLVAVALSNYEAYSDYVEEKTQEEKAESGRLLSEQSLSQAPQSEASQRRDTDVPT